MKVYLVTRGEYSDYRVMGVFDSKEKAEYALKVYAADNIEEREMNALPDHTPGYYRFGLEMDKDGNTIWTYQRGHDDEDWEEEYYPLYEPWMFFHVLARDEEHAIKIVNEKRIRMLAENIWPQWKH